MFGKRLAIGLAFVLACAAGVAGAADGTWTLNNNGNWSTPGNWSGGTVADGADSTAFLSNIINGNRNITLDSVRTIGSIFAQDTSHNYSIVGANALTLDVTSGQSVIDVVSGRTLTISAPIIANDGIQTTGAGTVSFSNAGLTLGSSQIWDNASTLSVTGIISDGGNAYSLTKTGSGRLLLLNSSANQNFTGGLTINGGEVEFRRNDNGSAQTTLGAGNIDINGGVLTAYWSYTFSRVQGTGAGEVQITGGVSGFGGNGGSGGTFNIGDVTWGNATFSPTEFVLQAAGANNNGNSIFQSNIDLNGADRTIRSDQTGGNIVSGVGRFSGNITNGGATAGIIKTGIGQHVFQGSNTYDGGTTINQGGVLFDGIASMPASGNVQVNDGALLGIQVGGGGNWTGGTSGVGTIGGLLAGDGGAGTATVGYSGNVGVQLDVASNTTYSGNIANVGTTLAIHKTGTSTLTLDGNNTYSGGTFLYQGTLIADSATALSTGNITFRGGTLQYTANSAATDFGSQIKNSTSAMLINTNSQNVSLSGMTAGNTGGLTKSGGGTLTFTGTNTYSGATNLNAGTIAVYDGTLTTSGGAVNMVSNTTISVLGGGVNSTWNLSGQQLGTPNNVYTNLQITIDGDGVAGSALVTNVGTLVWGRTATNSGILLTDGGQMNVNGEIRIGNPYYSTAGNATMTIGGGTATSTFSGDGGDDFYIGYGERENSNNNVVTVNSGGVLTNIRNMFVGHVNNQQGNDLASTDNRLTVTGTGTASMTSISVGYAQNAGIVSAFEKANANVVEITSGGQLTTSATNHIGRANNNFTESNANTATISGTGSTWNAGNQIIYVGHTNNAGAVSNNNTLTVASGGVLTNVSSLVVGFGTGTETGNQVILNGGTISTGNVTVSLGNTLSGSGTLNVASGVTVNGILAPGNSIGTMNVGGNLTWTGAAAAGSDTDWVFELGAGNTADLLDITGDFLADTGAGSAFRFDFAGSTDTGTFDLVTWTGNTTFNESDFSYTNYAGGSGDFQISGQTLQFVVVPEPAALALLACGGAIGFAVLRRRR